MYDNMYNNMYNNMYELNFDSTTCHNCLSRNVEQPKLTLTPAPILY